MRPKVHSFSAGYLKAARRARRHLSGHARKGAKEILREVASSIPSATEPDRYGGGAVLERLEGRLCRLLGKDACAFMPSGVMAQNIALRIWCDRARNPRFAAQPLTHLELHEEQAYSRLHGLTLLPLGEIHRVPLPGDLDRLRRKPAAILLELPQRELGGALPEWQELKAFCLKARKRGIRLHLDGARLWECQPYYGRSLAEIAALFDSVYVSFYKGLGGIAGSALLGSTELIAEARQWQRRQGGTLVQIFPYALSAEQGLRLRLPRMGRYAAKARRIAAQLRRLPGVRVQPEQPPTNMFHVAFEGTSPEQVERACRSILKTEGVGLFGYAWDSPALGTYAYEVVVGDRTLELSDARIVRLFRRLLAESESQQP